MPADKGSSIARYSVLISRGDIIWPFIPSRAASASLTLDQVAMLIRPRRVGLYGSGRAQRGTCWRVGTMTLPYTRDACGRS